MNEKNQKSVHFFFYQLFYDCTSLSLFDCPSTITSIGSYSFYNCIQLSSFDFSTKTQLSKISDRSFQYSGIETAVFPSSLNSVDVSSFESSCLKTVSFSSNTKITAIPWLCFAYCKLLETLILTDSIKTIDEESFIMCINLQSVLLPHDIESIESRAFYSCTSLNEVTLSLNCNLQTVKGQAFGNCPMLTEIKLQSGESNFKFMRDVLLSYNLSIIYVYLSSSKNRMYVVPSNVQKINPYAFQQCNNLQTVVIPDGTISYIGLYAFEGCQKLENLYLPNTLSEVGVSAFANCKKLQCGSVQISNEGIKDTLISRGIPEIAFSTDCPTHVFSCINNHRRYIRTPFVIFGAIYTKA